MIVEDNGWNKAATENVELGVRWTRLTFYTRLNIYIDPVKDDDDDDGDDVDPLFN